MSATPLPAPGNTLPLAGKVALVTGGGTGIGRAAALRYAASLNLLAVLALSSGDWQTAKRFWTRACQRDPHYVPASQNLRRYFELCTFGTSKQPLSLGDERRCENSRSRELL